MNQKDLLDALSGAALHLAKAVLDLKKVVDDKSSDDPISARRRTDAKSDQSQILQVIARLDKQIIEVEKEECEFCDTKKSTPNFAYHFCSGRKTPK